MLGRGDLGEDRGGGVMASRHWKLGSTVLVGPRRRRMIIVDIVNLETWDNGAFFMDIRLADVKSSKKYLADRKKRPPGLVERMARGEIE